MDGSHFSDSARATWTRNLGRWAEAKPRDESKAPRYKSGSTMVVRTWFGEYVIAPRKP